YHDVRPGSLESGELRIHDIDGLKDCIDRSLGWPGIKISRDIHGNDNIRTIPPCSIDRNWTYDTAVDIQPASYLRRPENAWYRAARPYGSPRVTFAKDDFLA